MNKFIGILISNFISFPLLLIFVLFLFGCGNSETDSEDEVPVWFVNIPQEPNFLYAAKTATSRDMQMAIDKAITSARVEIARELMDRRSTKDISIILTGSKVIKQKHVKEGNHWRAYVLVECPIGVAN